MISALRAGIVFLLQSSGRNSGIIAPLLGRLASAESGKIRPLDALMRRASDLTLLVGHALSDTWNYGAAVQDVTGGGGAPGLRIVEPPPN